MNSLGTIGAAWASIRNDESPLAEQARATLRLVPTDSVATCILQLFSPTPEKKEGLFCALTQEFQVSDLEVAKKISAEWNAFKRKGEEKRVAFLHLSKFAHAIQSDHSNLASELYARIVEQTGIDREVTNDAILSRAILLKGTYSMAALRKLDARNPTSALELRVRFWLTKLTNKTDIPTFRQIVHHPNVDPETKACASYIIAKTTSGAERLQLLNGILEDRGVSLQTRNKADRLKHEGSIPYLIDLLEQEGKEKYKLQLALLIKDKHPAIARELLRYVGRLGAKEVMDSIEDGKRTDPEYPYLQAIDSYLQALAVKTSDPSEAKRLLEQVMENPAAYDELRDQAYYELALLAGSAHMYENLLQSKTTVHEIKSRAHFRLGLLLKESDPKKALYHFVQAKSSDLPNDLADEGWYEWACLLKFTDPREAIRHCKMIGSGSFQIKALYLRAEIHRGLKENDKAIARFDTILEMAEPGSTYHVLATIGRSVLTATSQERWELLRSLHADPNTPKECAVRISLEMTRYLKPASAIAPLREFLRLPGHGYMMQNEIKLSLAVRLEKIDPNTSFKLLAEILSEEKRDPEAFQVAWAYLAFSTVDREKGLEALLKDQEATDLTKQWAKFHEACHLDDPELFTSIFMDDSFPAEIRAVADFFIRYPQCKTSEEKAKLYNEFLDQEELPFLFRGMVNGLFYAMIDRTISEAVFDLRKCRPIYDFVAMNFIESRSVPAGDSVRFLFEIVNGKYSKKDLKDRAFLKLVPLLLGTPENPYWRKTTQLLGTHLQGADYTDSIKIKLRVLYARLIAQDNWMVAVEMLTGVLNLDISPEERTEILGYIEQYTPQYGQVLREPQGQVKR